jgi:hypothetical protein
MKQTKEAILAIIVAFTLLILAACLSGSVQNNDTPEPPSLETVETKPPLMVASDDETQVSFQAERILNDCEQEGKPLSVVADNGLIFPL